MAQYIVSFDPALVNMAYCVVNIHTLKIHKWGLFCIKGITNEITCRNMAKHLDELALTKDLNCIVIHEQQPRCNVKTITICGQLQMYYVLEKMKNNNIEKIVGHHAKNKIKYYKEKPGDEPMPWEKLNNLKAGHYRTKKILIEQCKRILKQNDENTWLEWFEKQPKADDVADAYVQALSYIEMNNLRIG